MKIYFNSDFTITKREYEEYFLGSEYHNKIEVYFPMISYPDYTYIYPVFNVKRPDNRKFGEFALTEYNVENDYIVWTADLPAKALEVEGTLEITILFKYSTDNKYAKVSTGKVLLNVKEAVIGEENDVIFTGSGDNLQGEIDAIRNEFGVRFNNVETRYISDLSELNNYKTPGIYKINLEDLDVFHLFVYGYENEFTQIRSSSGGYYSREYDNGVWTEWNRRNYAFTDNLKTINGESIVGSGDIEIKGGSGGGVGLTAVKNTIIDNYKEVYLATANAENYTVVQGKYIRASGGISTLAHSSIFYYEVNNNLDKQEVVINTRIEGIMAIVCFNENDVVLASLTNTMYDNGLHDYFIPIPLGTKKIAISCIAGYGDLPSIKLLHYSKEEIKTISTEVYNELNANKEELVIEKNGGACRIFHDWGCIGDSLSSGVLEHFNDGTTTEAITNYNYSFGKLIGRTIGANVDVYARGGLTAKTLFNSINEVITPLWNSTKQVYTIGLGTNDLYNIDTYTKGWGNVETDIDLTNYNNNADSFVGWYAKIIQRIREVNKDCYLFLLSNPINHSENQLAAITAIASKFTRCFVINTYPYRDKWNTNYKLGWHLSPYGYQVYADYVMSLISKLILEDESKFKNVGFIGTEHKNSNYD